MDLRSSVTYVLGTRRAPQPEWAARQTCVMVDATRPAWRGGFRQGMRRPYCRRRSSRVYAKIVVLHHPFQLQPILRIGGVDAGQCIRESLRVLLLLHRAAVAGAGREQAAMLVERLGNGRE